MDARIEKLEQLVKDEKIQKSSLSFASSLITQFHKNGKLSEKQWYWVEKLVRDATLPKPENKEEVGAFKKVYALFEKAAQHLKYPSIIFEVQENEVTHTFKFYRSGPNSSRPGVINITDGRPYGENKWYGRIDTDGVWQQPQRNYQEISLLRKLIKELASNPEKVAADQGHLTGRCCFCHSKLTDDRSIKVGYGPVCAKHYGLAWGCKVVSVY